MAHCSECGGLIADALRFCIHCGKEIKVQKAVVGVSKPEGRSVDSVAQPVLNATNKKSNTMPLVAVLVLVVVVLAGIIFVMSRSNSSGEAEDKTNVATTIASDAEQEAQFVVEVPSDAEPLKTNTWDAIATPTEYPMSELTCSLLAASLDFDDCLSASSMGSSFAITVKQRPSQVDNFDYFYLEVIKFTENGSASYASPVYSRSIRNESSDFGMDLALSLQGLQNLSGATIAVQTQVLGPSRTYSSYTFWGLDSSKSPKIFAEFSGEGMNPLATDEYLVVTEYAYRDGEPMCCGTLTNHYRLYMQPDQWFVLKTTLDKDEADALEATYASPKESSGLTLTGDLQDLYNVAPEEYWIDGYEMAKPACDGSYITSIMGAGAGGIISGVIANPEASYLRTDITCASLNPTFSSGSLEGQPIYVLFYGPYQDRFEAQNKCLELGLTKKAKCYVAPLTDNESDRQVRYGPNDN